MTIWLIILTVLVVVAFCLAEIANRHAGLAVRLSTDSNQLGRACLETLRETAQSYAAQQRMNDMHERFFAVAKRTALFGLTEVVAAMRAVDRHQAEAAVLALNRAGFPNPYPYFVADDDTPIPSCVPTINASSPPRPETLTYISQGFGDLANPKAVLSLVQWPFDRGYGDPAEMPASYWTPAMRGGMLGVIGPDAAEVERIFEREKAKHVSD